MIKKYLSLCVVLAVLISTACEKETRPLKQIEDEEIQAYLTKNNLTGFIKDSTGYYYKVISVGEGIAIDNPSYVGISQTTTSINKNVNYSFSKYTPQYDYLGYISPGSWRETLLKVKKGGEVRVITPSYLAFGKNGSGTVIPGNAILDSKISVANDTDRPAYEESLINQYLTENSLTASKDADGIYYSITTAGTGTAITSTSATVKVAYTGKLLTGAIFDQATTSSPLTIGLSSVIEGWKKALPLIKAGGKIKLYIPSRYAYGANSPSGIPANAILAFDIELIEVTN